MTPKILAVIPARGGSKGVPHKNIQLVGGKPLIQYAIDATMGVKDALYRTIVSTDDEEIAEIARKCGAEVPFLRPADLASDKSPMVPVLQHAISFVEEQDKIELDWVLLLQPTALFRTTDDLKNAIRLALAGGCDSVISTVQVFSTHPILMKKIVDNQLVPFCIEEKEGTRRQDYHPPAYMRNGAIYLSKRDAIMKKNSIWGDVIRPYVMPEERSVNIDSLMDFRLAQMMLDEQQGS
jgi:CMP-N-acetylneuraminic acid synthetase